MTKPQSDGCYTWQTLALRTCRVGPGEPFEVHVTNPDQRKPWQALRLQASDRQEDGVYRLCLRNLKVSTAYV